MIEDDINSERDLTVEQISVLGLNALLTPTTRNASALEPLAYETVRGEPRAHVAPEDIIAVLQPHLPEPEPRLPHTIQVEMESSGLLNLFKGTGSSVHRFIVYFMAEIRKRICKGKTAGSALGHTTTGTLAALSVWLMESFKISSHMATAVAAAILVAISSAAKGAFCKMTEAQAKAAIESFVKAPRKRRAK